MVELSPRHPKVEGSCPATPAGTGWDRMIKVPGNTKGGSITVPLTSCLTGFIWSVLQIKTNIVNCQTAYSKPVKQEVNGTVILPPLVFPESTLSPCGKTSLSEVR
jgi:hypothetical protein